jgi:hypothetical protein
MTNTKDPTSIVKNFGISIITWFGNLHFRVFYSINLNKRVVSKCL